MNCSRREWLSGDPCPSPATYFVVGPSGMGNALCKHHHKALFKRWTSDQGFTVMTLFTIKDDPKPGVQHIPVGWPSGATL